jgi:hypothetical protein
MWRELALGFRPRVYRAVTLRLLGLKNGGEGSSVPPTS